MIKKSLLRKDNHYLQQKVSIGYLFTIPSFIGFIVFIIIPLASTAVMSFGSQNLFTGTSVFVGVDNYIKLFTDSRTTTILGNSIWYAIFCPIGNTCLGLLLAVMLDDKLKKGSTIVFRSIFFFPTLVSIVFVAIIWQFLFQTDTGVINYYLSMLGIGKVAWLTDPDISKASVWIMDVWKNAGMAMLLLLAGIQSVSKELYESAYIDGAGSITSFFKITIPLVSPTLFFVYIINLTGALRIFESILVLTGGGPGDSSLSLAMLIYEKGFSDWNYGAACALSMILLVVIATITAIQFTASRKWVHYE